MARLTELEIRFKNIEDKIELIKQKIGDSDTLESLGVYFERAFDVEYHEEKFNTERRVLLKRLDVDLKRKLISGVGQQFARLDLATADDAEVAVKLVKLHYVNDLTVLTKLRYLPVYRGVQRLVLNADYGGNLDRQMVKMIDVDRLLCYDRYRFELILVSVRNQKLLKKVKLPNADNYEVHVNDTRVACVLESRSPPRYDIVLYDQNLDLVSSRQVLEPVRGIASLDRDYLVYYSQNCQDFLVLDNSTLRDMYQLKQLDKRSGSSAFYKNDAVLKRLSRDRVLFLNLDSADGILLKIYDNTGHPVNQVNINSFLVQMDANFVYHYARCDNSDMNQLIVYDLNGKLKLNVNISQLGYFDSFDVIENRLCFYSTKRPEILIL